MSADRAALVEEVDLALAALRRVILRAIQAPAAESNGGALRREMPKPVLPAAKDIATPWRSGLTAPKAAVQLPPAVNALGIAVLFSPPSVTFASRTAEVSFRQAQLVAVLAPALGKGWVPLDELTRRAWPELAVSSREIYLSAGLSKLQEILRGLGLRLAAARGFGISLAIIEEEARP